MTGGHVNDTSRHPGHDEIALYIEGRLDERAAARLAAHLESCRDCSAVYRDAAMALGLWEADAGSFDAPTDAVAAGKGIAAAGTRRCARRPRRRLAPALTACAILVVAAALWLARSDGPARHAPDGDIPTPLRAAAGRASARGTIVIPGGEFALAAGDPAYRSSGAFADNTVSAALSRLYRRYMTGDATEDETAWLAAGYLATGRLETARELLAHARSGRPDDPRLLALDGIARYLAGDLAGADRLLARALDARPDDAVSTFNLALVRAARGDTASATSLLESVVALGKTSPLTNRADSLLAALRR